MRLLQVNKGAVRWFALVLMTASVGFWSAGCTNSSKNGELGESEAAKIRLGQMLYFDTRLSKDNTISCNPCHNVANGGAGVDGLPTSLGIGKQKGGRNAPTVWNAKFLSVQFWDGRAPNLKEQAKGPITNPIEMGMDSHDVAVQNIQAVEGYRPYFKEAFGSEDAINIENIAEAIASFEKTLVTLNSPYDKFKAGDQTALTDMQQKGLQLFNAKGCVACHSGTHFAGPELPEGTGFFQKFPTFPNKYDRKYKFSKDLGRYEVTKDPADKNMWRVPTLRNVALTSPYFHNGKVKTLDEAVRVMALSQLNQKLTAKEVAQLVAFLKSLTGEIPHIEKPELP